MWPPSRVTQMTPSSVPDSRGQSAHRSSTETLLISRIKCKQPARHRWLFTAALIGLGLSASHRVSAAADLSIDVSVTPATFWPGSSATIAMTLHNAGPDVAGAGSTIPFPIFVLQRGIPLPTMSVTDIPYNIYVRPQGCNVASEVVGPLPDLSFQLVWTFHFAAIPAGESRSCEIPITFYNHATSSFPTYWLAFPDPTDPNLLNNRVNYEFVRGAPPPPTPVPIFSSWGRALQALGLLLLANWGMHRIARRSRWPTTTEH